MKKIIILGLYLASLGTFAASNYITGIQKVTFRTGPGTDNKIIRMLETDSKVEVLESGETWTKVKDTQGDEGYVLSRFLNKSTPYKLRFDWLKKKHEKLQARDDERKVKNQELIAELKRLQEELVSLKSNLENTEKSFDELKDGSADYIGLKANYDKTVKKLSEQSKKVKDLESKISIYYIKWFLAGGGVLLLGWIIGLMSRKKKSYSGLRL